MLKSLKSNIALEISGISYVLIKAANSATQKVFKILAKLCIRRGEILLK
jgi:hypothetical protein